MPQPNFCIIVPIFEETQALSFADFYYRQLGFEPIFALDSKRLGRRNEVEHMLGREVAIYNNLGNCIEAHYSDLAALSPMDWVLRIDCDEVPNLALLKHAERFVSKPTDAYCGFDRDDLIWRNGQFERLKYAPFFVDTQFRLFDRRKVKFISRIHTPGFHVPKWKLPFLPKWNAPRHARLYHLQRTFITTEQRAEKLLRYNGAGQEAKFNDWLARPDESFKWLSFHDEAFTANFAKWKAEQKP